MADSAAQFDTTLAAVPLFSGISRRQRSRLLDKSSLVEHRAGQEIAREGAGALALHVVLEGTATVTLHGREVRTLGPGEYFGEISMIDGKARSATVTAAEPLRTLVVPHLAFHQLLRDDPEVGLRVLGLLCARLREVEATVTS